MRPTHASDPEIAMTRARPLLLFAPALTVALLAGCSGGGDSGGATEAAGGDAALPAAREASVGADTAGPGDGPARTAARVLPADRDLVYRGSITVRVRDVNRAADRATFLAEQAGGLVQSQQTTLDPLPARRTVRRALGEARLTLRVPPPQFRATLDALGRLGRELERSRSAEDVTTQLADVDGRVRSQERSVERLRTLLGEADTVGEVVQIESELARREADLESLQAQLARLRDVTDLATIEVLLVAHQDGAPPPRDDDLGFLSGLRGGWEALVAAVLVTVTVLGALLPFVVTAALVGGPAWLLLRRRRRTAVAGEVSQ